VTTVRLEGLDGVLALLKRLPPEVVSKRGGPVRAALRKGAVVILKQAQANLQQSVSNAADQEQAQSTGLLLKNLVVTRGKEPADGKGERYLVRVRRKSYGRKGAQVTTLKTAQLLEYGSSQQPAEPWLRPAFSATARQAIATTETELLKSIDRIVRKLGKKGGLS
jgi:HK97 gp10 family phage protein